MKDIKFEFIIDNEHISAPYTLEEIIKGGISESDILEHMEVCTCQYNESVNHCEGDCIRFENSTITGKRMFTGFLDRNKVEIYEFDKVIVPKAYGGDVLYEQTEGIVFFESGEFVIDTCGRSYADYCWSELEVIGYVLNKKIK